MKKLILMFLLFTPIMFSCGSDDEYSPNEKELAEHDQVRMYNNVVKNIIGHWKGVQYYNAPGSKNSVGWEDISNIKWTNEYIFNSDGTCKCIYSPDHSDNGIYTIEKNKDYINEPSIKCELFLIITFSSKNKEDAIVSKRPVWMDGEYLRLSNNIDGLKLHESSGIGGELAIRYKKQ